jgi:hypothetical protein
MTVGWMKISRMGRMKIRRIRRMWREGVVDGAGDGDRARKGGWTMGVHR